MCLVRQGLMVPVLALSDPLSTLNSHRCFTLGVRMLGRYRTIKSEGRALRKWKDMALL